MSSQPLEEKNMLQPNQRQRHSKRLHCCRRGEAARDAFPKLANWQARGPVPLTEGRINLNMNSYVACWHNITAFYGIFFQQVAFNLCPDISRQSCLISPVMAGHLPTLFPKVRIFGSPAGWGPANHDLPHESSSSLPLKASPPLRLTIASKKFSNLLSWLFHPSSHTLPPSSWPGRLKNIPRLHIVNSVWRNAASEALHLALHPGLTKAKHRVIFCCLLPPTHGTVSLLFITIVITINHYYYHLYLSVVQVMQQDSSSRCSTH